MYGVVNIFCLEVPTRIKDDGGILHFAIHFSFSVQCILSVVYVELIVIY